MNEPNFEAPISINAIHSFGMYIHWKQPTIGFGEFSIGYKDGKVSADTEGMGPEWCRRAMYAAVDAIIEQAKKDGVWKGK